MSITDTHARVKARVWQALAQADLDMSELPKEKLESLVDTVTSAAILEVDAQLNASLDAEKTVEAQQKGDTATDPFDPDPLQEDILWEGRPLLSITTRYIITDERLRIIEGIMGKAREDIELIRIQDLDQKQTFSERLLNIGDITIRSHDRSHPIIILNNINDPEAVHEILRRAVLNARKKHGLYYREEM